MSTSTGDGPTKRHPGPFSWFVHRWNYESLSYLATQRAVVSLAQFATKLSGPFGPWRHHAHHNQYGGTQLDFYSKTPQTKNPPRRTGVMSTTTSEEPKWRRKQPSRIFLSQPFSQFLNGEKSQQRAIPSALSIVLSAVVRLKGVGGSNVLLGRTAVANQ